MELNLPKIFSPRSLSYGWVVVAISCLSLAIFFGIESSFGVFYKALSLDLNVSGMALSAVFSLGAISRGMFSFVYGWFCDYFGPRWTILTGGLLVSLGLFLTSRAMTVYQLYIFYSILVGMACACSVVPLTSTVSRWFTEGRGTAVGIVTGGIGLGTLIMAPVSNYLLESMGWRDSYVVLSVITAGVVLITAVLVKNPGKRNVNNTTTIINPVTGIPDNSKKNGGIQTASGQQFSFKQAVSDKSYRLLFIISFTACLASNIPILILVNYAINTGIEPAFAAIVLGAAGGASVAGRFLGGALSDKTDIVMLLLGALLIQGLSIAGFLFTRSPLSFFVVAVIFGISWGICVPLFPMMIARDFGIHAMGATYGLQFLGGQIGAALGPFLAGFTADLTGNYIAALIIGATVSIAGAFLCMGIKRNNTESSFIQ